MSRIKPSNGAKTLSWTHVRVVLMLVDFVALVLALEFAYLARYSLGWTITTDSSTLDPVVPAMCLAIALISYRVFDLYSIQLVGSGLNEYRAVVMDTTFAFAAIVVVEYIDENLRISRAFLLLFWLAAIVLVGVGRFLARRVVRRWSALRGGLRRVLIVGANEQGVQIAEELTTNPAACSIVLGFLSEYRPVGRSTTGHFNVLGEPMELYEIAKRVHATHAVVVESSLSWESLRFIIRSMHASRSPEVLLAPGLFDVAATPLRSTQLGRALLLAPRANRIYGFEALFKRVLDLGVAMSALVITFPLQVGIWVYLRLSGTARPVEALRCSGVRGEIMTIRWFAGGARLRASHLTRLPYLWQVVRGRMSLIGPRPAILDDAGRYEQWRDVLMPLKPGFIGPWWLSGHGRPSELAVEIEADLNYARSYSIWLDLRILLTVAWVLLTGWMRSAPSESKRAFIGAPVNVGDDD
jgi:lipopolysaccharide/colanic/teichoic acid biosynthesis glycosyltransferase